MAAAATSNPSVNYRPQDAYPIRLGSSITKSPGASLYTSVRFNYAPRKSTSETLAANISTDDSQGQSELTVQSKGGTYRYMGVDSQREDSFVFVVKERDELDEVILERVDSHFEFDVVSTPSESSATKLAELHPPLPVGYQDEEDDNLFGDEDDEFPIDTDNPFDYRHFLKPELDKLEITNAATDNTARSSAATPLARPQTTNRASAAKDSKRAAPSKAAPATKRKAAAATKPNPKRVKAGQEPQTQADVSAKPSIAQIPKVRVDRKASIRRSSIDDSDELILENDTPADEKPSKPLSAMTIALTNHIGNGPISLRSAVSSPASRIASPMPPRPAGLEEEYEFQFGDSSPESSRPASRHTSVAEEAEAHEGNEEDDNADVEALELPSPATQKYGASAASSAPQASAGDDDDDLDQQLRDAMAEEDDGLGISLGHAESEEESEEE